MTDNSDVTTQPQATDWRIAVRILDWRSLAFGLLGLVVWLGVCVVWGAAVLGYLNGDSFPHPISQAVFTAVFGLMCIPMIAAFGLAVFVPLLLFQRLAFTAVFVAGTVVANLLLLAGALSLFAFDPATSVIEDITPLLFGFCVTLSVLSMASQWITSKSLRPKMKVASAPRRVSIRDLMGLMSATALTFGIARLALRENSIEAGFYVAIGFGIVTAVIVATMVRTIVPCSAKPVVSNQWPPSNVKRRLQIAFSLLVAGTVAAATTFAWAVWMGAQYGTWPLEWDEIIEILALAAASVFNAVLMLACVSVGLFWIRFCGWTIQSSRRTTAGGEAGSSVVAHAETDSARSTAETDKSA
tara:strand:+ start:5572 stop:6639 length:1068 start_codon:yes stop_codon:yes gene_type:complete